MLGMTLKQLNGVVRPFLVLLKLWQTNGQEQ
jgi:hypothetical protein